MRTFSASFFLLCVLNLSAQEPSYGVFMLKPTLGFNACQIHGDNYSGFDKFGFLAGIALNARLNEATSLELGFYFSQKGSRHNQNPKIGDYSFYRLNLNYVDLPLSLRYHVNPRYFITLGPSFAYLINYSENINNADYTGVYKFNKYEWGVNFGLGRSINNKFSVEVRTSNSVTPIRSYGVLSNVFYPNPVARFFNKGFYNNIISVIFAYHLNRKKRTNGGNET
jgi:hypothetical protein